MKTLATLIRHVVTYLIGLLVAWLAIYLTGDDLKTATDAANALVEPLVIVAGFVGVILARLAMPIFNRIFRVGAGEENANNDGGSGMMPLLVAACMIGGLTGLFLTSCTPSFPVRIGIQGPGVSASYSAKGGLRVDAIVRGTK